MKPNQTKTKQKQTNTWTLESEVWRCSQTAVQSSWLVSMPHVPVLCKGRDRGARKHLGSKFSVGSIKSMWPVGIADMKHKGRWNPGPLWELASYLSSPGWKAQMLGGSTKQGEGRVGGRFPLFFMAAEEENLCSYVSLIIEVAIYIADQ